MTSTILPVADALTDPATADTHGWEIRGPFDFERWGTLWAVHHTSTHTLLTFCSDPGECRDYIGSGRAQADLDRLLEHDRGGHDSERDKMCRRC